MAFLTIQDCVANRSPGRLLRRIDKAVWRLVEDRFADAEISYVEWIALKALRDDIVSTAGELAREIDMTTGATTRLIDGLEREGLLLRDRSGTDRRVVRLHLTEAGRTRILTSAPHMVGAWNELLEDFDQAEVAQLVGLLAKLLDTIERKIGEPAPVAAEVAA